MRPPSGHSEGEGKRERRWEGGTGKAEKERVKKRGRERGGKEKENRG